MPENKVKSVNPATEELLKEFTLLSDDQLEQKVQKAVKTYQEFKNTSFEQRAQWMNRVAELLEKNAENYGRTLTMEMGRPSTFDSNKTRLYWRFCRSPKDYECHITDTLIYYS
jgi:succinate-semialdehyde dehydrogenase/glutarate-semialdehyde dehydrogenase